MDEVWNDVKNKFHLCIEHLPLYSKIIDSIVNMNFKEIPNILLHGCHGIPFNFIWNIALHKKFGDYIKVKHVWGKDIITYYETPYFFEIDLFYPHQTKDMVLFSEFIKEIVSHPCMHEDRHIIIIEGLDQISDKLRSTALRVLLERYSKNVFFICTTSHVSQIEDPIRSRFLNIRCPVFTPEQIDKCFTALGRTFHPLLKQNECYDFYFALFISYLLEKHPDQVTESLCNYKLPFFHEFLLSTINKPPTIEEIRKITQQVSIHNASFNMITHDLLLFYKNCHESIKLKILHSCTEVDHMCSVTEEYRKPLYIELLLNIVFNKIINIDEKQLVIKEEEKKETTMKKTRKTKKTQSTTNSI